MVTFHPSEEDILLHSALYGSNKRARFLFWFNSVGYEVTLASGCFGLDAMLRAIICGLAKGKTSRTQHDDVPNGHDLPPFMSQVINRW